MSWLRYDHADNLPVGEGGASAFKAKVDATESLLDRELDLIEADEAAVLTGHTPGERIRTGRPTVDPSKYAYTKATVRLIVPASSRGPLQITANRYRAWEDNLRAIALTLENLRAIERYGATSGEQYRGFLAIEAGDGGSRARQRLGEIAGVAAGDERPRDVELVRLARRAAGEDRPVYDEVTALARQIGIGL